MSKPAENTLQAATVLCRGTARYLRALGFSVVSEFPLASGRRADLVGIGAAGEIVIVEVKSCVADFRADGKWREYREFCDRFFFAVAADFPQALIPEEAGLVVADGYGAEMIRDNEYRPLPAARRKALSIRIARCAADRLAGILDPAGGPI